MDLLRDNEGDIDLTDNDIRVSELANVLEETLGETRPASPTTPEPQSLANSAETEYLSGTRRDTISVQKMGQTPGGSGTTDPKPTRPALSPDQLQQIILCLSGGTKKPKIKEPGGYRGEKHKIREWLAQLRVYFKAVEWAEGHDNEKILYAISLLRVEAGNWITPYIEELIPLTWENWAGFAKELRKFGIIVAKGKARITL